MNAIRKRAREFVAILALCIIAAAVGGYILSQQRFNVPAWVPLVGKHFFVLKGEFSTAQAVTPGQGQTVDIAGVKIGEIQKVELVNGRAVLTMNIDSKYRHAFYPDASMLLRPKTGLKDMIVEVDPGNPNSGPALRSGSTVPVRNTLPDINPDEILAALDSDTRQYLKLLLSGGGQALRGNGPALSAALRRFDPTARSLDRITRLLATRRQNLARVVRNFQLLSTSLGNKDQALSQLVVSADGVFNALAQENRNIGSSLQLLPGALNATQSALGKTDQLARALGPSLRRLRPSARALGPSLRATFPFLRDSTPIIRDKLRPFARAALPTTRELRPAAADLAELTPALQKSFEVVNYALNELGYNPGRDVGGYLFWLSWANHNAASVFSTQDAHGPIRRGLFLISCSTAAVLQQVAAINPQLATLVALTNPPLQATGCPSQTGPGNTPQSLSPTLPLP